MSAGAVSSESQPRTGEIMAASGPDGSGIVRDSDSRLPAYPNAPTVRHFLPGVPVKVFVVSADVAKDSKRLWHQIKIEHGPFKWVIYKTLLDILQLELRMNPTRIWARMSSARNAADAERFAASERNRPEESIANLPFFMSSKEIDMLQEVQEAIETFLSYIVSYELYRNHPFTSKFFEISSFSLKPNLGQKQREGFIQKRASCCCIKNAMWEKKWFVLKDFFLMYIDLKDGTIEGVFLFDNKSTVEVEGEKILKLKNGSYGLTLKCRKPHEAVLWKSQIQNCMDALAGSHPRESFAPVRQCQTHWFVDGCDYFSAVADALEMAKEEIFIEGWAIGPHIYLKRKHSLEDKWMLQSILKRKADAGVKIYVFIYDAPDNFIDLSDGFVKKTFEDLNRENIHVLRHRGRVIEGAILWSHHEKLVIVDQCIAFVSGIDLTYGRWDFKDHPLTDTGETDAEAAVTFEGRMWRGIDYANLYKNAGDEADDPFVDKLDRSKDPRMPWHDIASVTFYEGARDVARHYIERWNLVRATERKNHDALPFLLPKSTPSKEEIQTWTHDDATLANVQILRSASEWSNGIQETEKSIQEAYLQAIEQSEHFVYIENQFFISIHNNEHVKNKIVTALLGRIVRAKVQKQRFRLIVVLPLIPGLEGDFSKDSASEQIQLIAHYQYESISRGNGSLIASLSEMLSEEELREYVSFCALRAHAVLGGEPITEVLYVHSKMMIVDDRIAIIGSANINDRSMSGDRDSEVVIRVEDTEMIDSVMDGRDYKAGKFSCGLRRRVFAEHLGLLPEDYDGTWDFEGSHAIQDVLSDEFYWNIWRKTARSNTEIYDEVFRAVPNDKIRKFSQVEEYQTNISEDAGKRQTKLQEVKGFLVEFPLSYLEEENLLPNALSALKVAPNELWT